MTSNRKSQGRALRLSKFLSLVLRHRPEAAGVTLDAQGWVSIDALLAGCVAHGVPLSRDELLEIVRGSDKQRFAAQGDLIRANQGHSVDVDLALAPARPPATLFHGTVERFVPSIRAHGLVRGKRSHVHLSPDVETARLARPSRREGAARAVAPVLVGMAEPARHRVGSRARAFAARRLTNGPPGTAQRPVSR